MGGLRLLAIGDTAWRNAVSPFDFRVRIAFGIALTTEETLKRLSLPVLIILLLGAVSGSLLFAGNAYSASGKGPLTPDDLAKYSAEKSLGSPTAPIRLEVFSDYQCPTCGAFYEQTLRPMIDDYVANGKVYLVHHDFPLPMHQYSREAARWANAAARIGKFEAVDRALFDNQAAWSIDGDLKKFVAAALTPAEFKRVELIMRGCQSDSHNELPACAVDPVIQSDISLGIQVPVRGTPTFIAYYRGKEYPPMQGLISWPILKQFFDTLLNQH